MVQHLKTGKQLLVLFIIVYKARAILIFPFSFLANQFFINIGKERVLKLFDTQINGPFFTYIRYLLIIS